MVSRSGSDELVTFSDEILIMTKAFVKQHGSLAETRYKREEFDRYIYDIEVAFWDLVDYCETEGLGTPWEDFITFIFDILSVCQSFLDENDMLTTTAPIPEHWVEETWNAIVEEMTVKRREQHTRRMG